MLSNEELLKIYPRTDPKEDGAIMGTLIISDQARVAMSDPEAIKRQLELNRFAEENPPIVPTVTLVPLSDEEAAKLFEKAEASQVQAIEPGALEPNQDPGNPVEDAVLVPDDTITVPEDVNDTSLSVFDPDTLDPGEEFVTVNNAVDDDPFVLSNEDDDTSIRVLPEDQFVQDGEDGLYVLRDEQQNDIENTLPEPTDEGQSDYYPNGVPYDDDGNLNPGWAINDETGEPYFIGGDFVAQGTIDSAAASRQYATLEQARLQAALRDQRKQANDGDWRVRLRLAPGANYLYRADDGKGTNAGILQPLAVTDGVVFPYMPQISTNYAANYSSYDLTHSNFRGYFYQNSYVDAINITATFTAQDTAEADYLLAVIHFFRSVTKMFYGQDAERGAPPPLVFIEGLGEFQFNKHPCVVSNFQYSLPDNVDYIRARSPNINATNMLQKRSKQDLPTNIFSSALERLANAGIKKGALSSNAGAIPAPPTLGLNSPTYVPTRIDIILTLLPMQTRSQVSKQFSLKGFANGNLLKGGFW